MKPVILALLLALQPLSPVVRDDFDMLEINHAYNEDAQPIFTQVIGWDWKHNRHVVAAYRVVQGEISGERLGSDWRVVWCDNGVLRDARSPRFIETWTQCDPELIDRDTWPMENRRDFRSKP